MQVTETIGSLALVYKWSEASIDSIPSPAVRQHLPNQIQGRLTDAGFFFARFVLLNHSLPETQGYNRLLWTWLAIVLTIKGRSMCSLATTTEECQACVTWGYGKFSQDHALKIDNSYKLWYVQGLGAWPNWSLLEDGFLFSGGQSCGWTMHTLEMAG